MKGLIGFFDILGYQNFLENNSATDSATAVLKIINSIPAAVENHMKKTADTKLQLDKEIAASFKHIVFSDTVMFTLPYPEKVSPEWILNAYVYMNSSAAMLMSQMFAMGLPMRGIIHEGEFIVENMCFAGKGIVDAYKSCTSLNLAALVHSSHLYEYLNNEKRIHQHGNDERFIFSYLTPKKDGGEEKMLHINWVDYYEKKDVLKIDSDPERFVLESFWAHQKDCSNSVDIKVRNTVKLIRKMLQNIKLHGQQA